MPFGLRQPKERLTPEEQAMLRQIEHEAYVAEKKAERIAFMEEKVKQAKEHGKKRAEGRGKRLLKGAIGASQKIMKFAQSVDAESAFKSFSGIPSSSKKKRRKR